MKVYDLVAALLSVAEKGANIARIIRSESSLLELLVQEKKGKQKNERFLQDFKTLADVLVQELVKFDLKTKFPGMADSIHGEESTKFTNTLGDTVRVEIQDTPEETQNLLRQVLDENDTAARILSKAIHIQTAVKDAGLFADQLDHDLIVDDLGVWIDPIDSTGQYIQGDIGQEEAGLVTEGLQCVSVLIGVYSKSTGLPIIGVINQPFACLNDDGVWTGSAVWGVSIADLNLNSLALESSSTSVPPQPDSDISAKQTILISSIESQNIQDILAKNYNLRHISGAGNKLLGLSLGKAAGYVLTQNTIFKWDCCGPHAILRSLGGGIVAFTDFERFSVSEEIDVCLLPQIMYNRPDVEGAVGAQKWCNHGGIVAYTSPTFLKELVSLFRPKT
ncbi:inositol polyphosphate 1-phosphatase-like [Mya arenaria]|uniref:inositol polyphosphate 1-phosphatase-like n=1 Tax=Mya arenaria TaxID=6604 RepID=UPI0022DFC5CD|nr:inositol polyphosphate 1-phosphatase-like [Mya arenaria]XP_052809148.1 inositol polyphosphate 1-phosphatase-like [Mya arenaria]